MKTKYVRVMAEFCADGLWDEIGSMIELPCPELNLPEDLLQRIESWQQWYTRDNQDYFEESRRTTTFDRAAFSKEGRIIAQDIKTYLGKEWTVMYFDDKRCHDATVDRRVFEYEIKNTIKSWLNNHAPLWIVVEHDPDRTWIRMILVALSFAPLFGILALLLA